MAGLREWREVTSSDSAVDYGLSLAISGRMDDPIGELAAVVDAGVPTCKAFMVFDFRLDAERILAAMRHHHGHKPAAARQLGISLRTLYYKLNAYRIQGYAC